MAVYQPKIYSHRDWPGCNDVALAGGKAVNLSRLYRFGFPVPPWWVISSKVFTRFCASFTPALPLLLDGIDFEQANSLQRVCGVVEKLFKENDLPERYFSDIKHTLATDMGPRARFAVRSSVVDEDSNSHSFAGLMDTFLNVAIDDIPEAVRRVWASAYSTRSLAYRHKTGLSWQDISAAVIIQAMISPESSGVLFSDDPVQGANTVVIVAGYGLGEGVVADRVETDTYRVDKKSGFIDKKISLKQQQVIATSEGNGKPRLSQTPKALKNKAVLTNSQIRRLRAAAQKAERCFGAAQDMEWAFDKHHHLYILQTRPIIIRNASPSGYRVWDQSNIVESYPGLTLPLTFSFIRDCYQTAFSNVVRSALLSRKALKPHMTIFDEMIGLHRGRVYYNLLSWYRMLSLLPGFQRHKQAWDQMIGIRQSLEVPPRRLSLLNRSYLGGYLLLRLLRVKANARRFHLSFDRVYRHFHDRDFETSGPDELMVQYQALANALSPFWHLTLYNDFSAMSYYKWLKQFCRRWGLEKYPNLHNDLLAGEKNMESVAPVRMLIEMAESINKNPKYAQLFTRPAPHIMKSIQSDAAFAPLKDLLERYLDLYGDRGIEELKLETPGFRERPVVLIQLLRKYVQSHLTLADMDRRDLATREKAVAFVRSTLQHSLRRAVFSLVLRNARLAISQREDMRFDRSRFYGITRRIFWRFGQIFEQSDVIATAMDIFYLSIDEIFDAVRGSGITRNLKSLVALRKREYREFKLSQPPERFHSEGIPSLVSFASEPSSSPGIPSLNGTGCSSGNVQGTARIVREPGKVQLSESDILVARSTDPGWVFLMLSVAGIVVEKGSMLSHTAIIGRELGIPTIIGARDATHIIPDGARIDIDGATGVIKILEFSNATPRGKVRCK